MKTQLKTLKDLNGMMTLRKEFLKENPTAKGIWRSEPELRQEASKWIKETRAISIREFGLNYPAAFWESRWCKSLNITEEDLA